MSPVTRGKAPTTEYNPGGLRFRLQIPVLSLGHSTWHFAQLYVAFITTPSPNIHYRKVSRNRLTAGSQSPKLLPLFYNDSKSVNVVRIRKRWVETSHSLIVNPPGSIGDVILGNVLYEKGRHSSKLLLKVIVIVKRVVQVKIVYF